MSGERNRLIDAAKNPSAALDYEIAQEIAATLGRLGRKLESALSELEAFDNAAAGHNSAERQPLLKEARAALWNFIVQREACGLRDARQVIIDYRVPLEVQHAVAVPPPTRRRTRA